ncbi:hypothetical protein [Bacillus sp. FJAT-45066]|uniref:hypothetical protein n=1 Tax=Bacillus sp. FJAT-45066 TaxID=2011010 RepID=UPI000BB8C426|nr:hypothetical protein [Bacillus sp. FJAT-45066]
MDFLTSTILAGLAWDGIKYIGNLTSEYLKGKLQEWIIDEEQIDEIASKINEFPEAYKKNEKFLELAIQEDEDLQELLKKIHPKSSGNVEVKDSVIEGSTINNAVGGSTINTSTTHNYYGSSTISEKKTRLQVKSELDLLLSENATVFKMYGPTPENTADLTTRKHEAWRSMALKFIVPNNDKIITLLSENIDLLNYEEKMVFMEFKLHAEGFKDNQNRTERIAEYPKFPIAINNILGG